MAASARELSEVCDKVLELAFDTVKERDVSESSNPSSAPARTQEKDRTDWVTGDEPMTGPQQSYLNTLAQEAGEELPDELTKADASAKIDELRKRTGRGT